MSEYKAPIIGGEKINIDRYVSGKKRDEKYKQTVDSVLNTLSATLNIPYIDLYNGLFFCKGIKSKGVLVIK